MSNFTQVAHFNTLIGNTAMSTENPDAFWGALTAQYHMIKEELEEMLTAIAERDVEQLRDATADVLVTTYGMAHRGGINADSDMDVVYESNMSKFCTSTDEALQTCHKYEKQGMEVALRYPAADCIAVVSAKDQYVAGKYYPKGKLLKSVNFKEPVLI